LHAASLARRQAGCVLVDAPADGSSAVARRPHLLRVMLITQGTLQTEHWSTPADHAGMAERPFGFDELFISTTDRKGHIRLGNKVFVRVSGYSEEEMAGRAHNIVRHPDMPRSVFKVFWDLLEEGRPVAAYVKNRAKNGDHYWVMAVVVPVGDGYASVRLKPSHELFSAARAIYQDVLAVERRIEGNDPRRRKEAMAAGEERLGELLREAGFADYPAFMRTALVAEIDSREQQLRTNAAQRLGTLPDGASEHLVPIVRAALDMRTYLDGLVDEIRAFSDVGEKLAGKASFVRALAEDMRLFALNALLASSRLEDGAALSAVAGIQRARFDALEPVLRALADDIVSAIDRLGEMSFRIAVSRVQAEMIAAFAHEHLTDGECTPALTEQLALLASSLETMAGSLRDGLGALDDGIRSLENGAVTVERELHIVRALQVNGRIEASRAPDTGQVRTLFDELGRQVDTAREQVSGFSDVRRILARDPRVERYLTEHAANVTRAVEALTTHCATASRPAIDLPAAAEPQAVAGPQTTGATAPAVAEQPADVEPLPGAEPQAAADEQPADAQPADEQPAAAEPQPVAVA
jgi:aerotaxis receptor